MSDRHLGLQAFLAELNRRHVFRVGLVYVIVGWIAIQVAAITFPALHLPAWATTLVVALLIAGFPIALVLAWAFEITPEGVRHTEAPIPRQGAEWGSARWGLGGWLAVLVVMIVSALAHFAPAAAR